MLTPRNPKQVSAFILSDNVIWENVKYYLADDFRKGGGPNPPDEVHMNGPHFKNSCHKFNLSTKYGSDVPFSNYHHMTECVHKAVKTCHPLSPKHTACDVSQLSHDCLFTLDTT